MIAPYLVAMLLSYGGDISLTMVFNKRPPTAGFVYMPQDTQLTDAEAVIDKKKNSFWPRSVWYPQAPC